MATVFAVLMNAVRYRLGSAGKRKAAVAAAAPRSGGAKRRSGAGNAATAQQPDTFDQGMLAASLWAQELALATPVEAERRPLLKLD